MRTEGKLNLLTRLFVIVFSLLRRSEQIRKAPNGSWNASARSHGGRSEFLSSAFSASWSSGYERVLILRLFRLEVRALRSPLGFLNRLLMLLVVCFMPFILNSIALWLGRDWAIATDSGQRWLAGFGAVGLIIVAAAYVTWRSVDLRSQVIDQLIGSADGEAYLRRWMNFISSYLVQVTSIIVLVVIGCAFLYHNEEQVSAVLEVGICSYLSVIVTCVLGGNALYWLYLAPLAVAAICRDPALRLWWQIPAATPGLRVLAQGLGVAISCLLAGGALIVALVFFGPRSFEIPAVQIVIVIFFTVIMLAILPVALVPIHYMSRAIVRSKNESISLIRDQSPDLVYRERGILGGKDSLRSESAELISVIDGSGNYPFRTEVFVQYGAAIIGTLLAFVLGLVVEK